MKHLSSCTSPLQRPVAHGTATSLPRRPSGIGYLSGLAPGYPSKLLTFFFIHIGAPNCLFVLS